jgi:hypothetical protein
MTVTEAPKGYRLARLMPRWFWERWYARAIEEANRPEPEYEPVIKRIDRPAPPPPSTQSFPGRYGGAGGSWPTLPTVQQKKYAPHLRDLDARETPEEIAFKALRGAGYTDNQIIAAYQRVMARRKDQVTSDEPVEVMVKKELASNTRSRTNIERLARATEELEDNTVRLKATLAEQKRACYLCGEVFGREVRVKVKEYRSGALIEIHERCHDTWRDD